jgi:hypothetical protein
MNKIFKQGLSIFVLMLLCQQSFSAIGLLNGSANRTQIQDGRNSSVIINWTGDSSDTGFNVPTNVSVFSNSGTFTLPNTTVLGVNNSRVSTNVILSPAQPVAQFSVRENLQIPQSIIYAAKKQGSLVVQYTRTFNDTSTALAPGTATVQFQIVSGSRGELSISRVDLRFDNDQVVRVIPIGEKISAVADINYNGVGLFDLAWEIATPASTQGEAFFTTLHTQRRYLGAGREAYIQSPYLPTETTGTYLVRLNIRSPETGFEPVVIRYVVIKSNKDIEPVDVGRIQLSKPLPKAVLSKDTKFNWQAIDGANAYQLEIYEYTEANEHPEAVRSLEDVEVQLDWSEDPKARSTGILVHGDKDSVGLSPISRQHLRPGYSYRWRVIAIGTQGRIIATSPLRTIRIPQ